MAISKIILNGITQIDLTQDTVSQANHILSPYVGHLNDGTQVTGTGKGGSVTWDTLYEGSATIVSSSPNYILIDNFTDVIEEGETWRITWDGTPYTCTPVYSSQISGYYIGNIHIGDSGSTDTGEPFLAYNHTATELAIATNESPGAVALLIERQKDTSATLITKTITLNGTYSAQNDSADGYSEVTINVANGASITEVANQYGEELVITSAEGSTPSVTRHTLYFEYEDETTETVYAYYDDALIGSAITATTPTTHNNKTVTSAQLDGVEWYSYTPEPTPSGNWTTLYDGQITAYDSEATIPSLADVYFAEGETYRVTIDGTEYVRETAYFDGQQSLWVVGNPNMVTQEPEAGEDQFCVFNAGWGALYVVFPGSESADHTFKLEKQEG